MGWWDSDPIGIDDLTGIIAHVSSYQECYERRNTFTTVVYQVSFLIY